MSVVLHQRLILYMLFSLKMEQYIIMQIQKMFAKPINRDIQGVIIVGQAEKENVQQELEEYVVTDELQKHFADFYKAIPRA